MQKIIPFFILVFSTIISHAQIYELNIHFGNTQNCEIRGMAVDLSGDIIVTGTFSQEVDFDPGPNETSIFGIGNSVGFIAKYNSSGEFVWVKELKTVTSFSPLDLQIDASGNIYITGSINGSVDLDPSESVLNVSSSGNYNGFFAKYNNDGDIQWGFRLPGQGWGLGLDDAANVYVTGQFTGTKYFQGVEPPNTAGGSGDAYLSKYNTDGTFQWVVQLGGTGNEIAYDLTVDNANEIAITGILESTTDFDPGIGTVTLTNGGDEDAFIAKYDANGDYVWAFNLGASGMTNGKSISHDSENNLIVGGDFQNTIDANPAADVSNLVSQGSYDIFISKYTSGGEYVWAHSFGATGGAEYTNEVQVDNDDDIYIAGRLEFGADVDPSANELLSFTSHFLASYDSEGSFGWYAPLGWVTNTQVYELVIDANNDVLIGGGMQKSDDLDPNVGFVGINNIGSGGIDALVVKYNKCKFRSGAEDMAICEGEEVNFGTQTLTEAGQYIETFTAVDGCDSLATLNLTVNPIYVEDYAVTITNNLSYIFGDQTLTEMGVYQEVFQTINGCDSTINLTLTVAPFAGGNGTSGNPWKITTIEHLNQIRNYNSDHFVLINDLDLSTETAGGVFDNGGLGWDPIDNFTGNFDGDGYTINGLTINRPEESNIGLFGVCFETEITNIRLTNVEISGLDYVGGLVGRLNTTTATSYFKNISVQGQVTSVEGRVGGIFGNLYSSDVEACFMTGGVTATSETSSNIGGIAGSLVDKGSLDLGILNSYAIANLTGHKELGGIVGSHVASTIRNCYHSGELNAVVAGFQGTYASSSNSPTFDSYWNSELSCFLNGSSANDLTTQSHFENWDFTNVWGIDEGMTYPYLLWQGAADDHNSAFFSVIAIPELQDVEANCSIELPNPLPVATSGCGNDITGISNVSFPITTVGTTTVTWTYTDELGKVNTQTQDFTINPDINPPVPEVTNLPDLEGQCSIEADIAPLAIDDCTPGVRVGVADVDFPITTQGTTVITWTYEDEVGNISTQTQNAIINDTISPVADLAELADINEVCLRNAISPPIAMDNCSGQISGVTDTEFPITAQGTTIVTWTFTDYNGNSIIQQQNVVLIDDIAPVPSTIELPTLFSNCDGEVHQPVIPTANDNCAGVIIATTNQVFPFSPSFDTQILWEYDDGKGNKEIQFQDVIIIQSDAVTVNESICDGDDFTFPDGTFWNGESSQVSTLSNVLGCDSLVTTNITVLPLPEIDLGDDIVFGCVGEELTFSIDESTIEFETYTISTLFGNSATDGALTFTFDQTFASTAASQDVFVTIELTNSGGCVGVDEVLIKDNTMVNWGIGIVQNNDPEIIISSTTLPETADSFEWDFGDGTTNSVDVNPRHQYTENGDYVIMLTVTNECGEESRASSVTISSIAEPLGLSNESNITIYPNPTQRYLKFDTDKKISVYVFGLDGKMIIKEMVEASKALDINELQTGQYVIHLLEAGEIIYTGKIIKRN